MHWHSQIEEDIDVGRYMVHDLKGGVALIGADNNFRSVHFLTRHCDYADMRENTLCLQCGSQTLHPTMRLRQAYAILVSSSVAAPAAFEMLSFRSIISYAFMSCFKPIKKESSHQYANIKLHSCHSQLSHPLTPAKTSAN
jgi:hypothetical protein